MPTLTCLFLLPLQGSTHSLLGFLHPRHLSVLYLLTWGGSVYARVCLGRDGQGQSHGLLGASIA